ncbi:MAG: hypothetical protein IPJ88_02800 [Myxococcales bacterium]|nr:MAG: hypothetical protein IPJ88_02800 [Myxococcales bacterium]
MTRQVFALFFLLFSVSACSDSHVSSVIEIVSPQEGAVLDSTADQDTGLDGFQFAVSVNTLGFFPDAELYLEIENGVSFVNTGLTATVGEDGTASFPAFTFAEGQNSIRVRNVDGTVQSSVRSFVVVNGTIADSLLSFVSPKDGDFFNMDGDCDDQQDGLQLQVILSSNAGDGNEVQLWVGGSPDSDAATATAEISTSLAIFCVSVADGLDIVLTAKLVDPAAQSSITVNVDTTPPPDAIATPAVLYFTDPTEVAQRRGGEVTVTWTAVSGGGDGDLALLQRYLLRCASSPINDTAAWDAAAGSELELSSVPQPAGDSQTEVIAGFERFGSAKYCAVRGEDFGGSLTPFGATIGANSVFVKDAFNQVGPAHIQNRAAELGLGLPATGGMGRVISAIGDVNGDTIDDFIVSGTAVAYLVLGSDTGFPSNPQSAYTTAFTYGSTSSLADQAVGIGDFNGDGMNDFAFSDSFENHSPGYAGSIYIIYGKAVFPSVLSVTDGNDATCEVDVCIRGTDFFGGLGVTMASVGNFNNDNNAGQPLHDLIIGSLGDSAGPTIRNGRVFVLLGSASYTSGTTITLPDTGLGDVVPNGFFLEGATGVRLGRFGLSPVSDIDSDGFDDFVVSGAGTDRTDQTVDGELHLILGRSYTAGGGLSQITLGTPFDSGGPGIGNANGYSSGYASLVRNVGDIDDDGDYDLAVFQALEADVDEPGQGEVVVYLASNGGYSSANTIVYTNNVANATDDYYGFAMPLGQHPVHGPLCDLDFNGSCDLVLISADEAPVGVGFHSVFYTTGSATAFLRSQAEYIFPWAGGGGSGFPGDVNGDGFRDVVITNSGDAYIYY